MGNKFVLITGSNKGLGKELAIVFASNGYGVILHGRNKRDLLRTEKEVLKKKVDCYTLKGDLICGEIIRQLYEIAKKKNISVLINNAAKHCPHLALEGINDREIENILQVNLIAPIRLAKKIYSIFKKRNYGTIININSISGLAAQMLRSIYCASKWGLRGFTESFRLEAEKYNVRVIGVYPRRIKTKPCFNYGMKASDVALRIFNTYKYTDSDEIMFDKYCEK